MSDFDPDYQRRRLVVSSIRDAVAHLRGVIRRAQDCCEGTPDMKTVWDFGKLVGRIEEAPEYSAVIRIGLRDRGTEG